MVDQCSPTGWLNMHMHVDWTSPLLVKSDAPPHAHAARKLYKTEKRVSRYPRRWKDSMMAVAKIDCRVMSSVVTGMGLFL